MISEIKAEAQALAEKQSWVRKGFQDLLEKMNAEVAPIVGEFKVRGKLCEVPDDYPYDYPYTHYLTLDGAGDAEFSIQYRACVADKFVTVEVARAPICKIRQYVVGLPAALDEVLNKMKELNGQYQETLELLSSLIARLS